MCVGTGHVWQLESVGESECLPFGFGLYCVLLYCVLLYCVLFYFIVFYCVA